MALFEWKVVPKSCCKLSMLFGLVECTLDTAQTWREMKARRVAACFHRLLFTMLNVSCQSMEEFPSTAFTRALLAWKPNNSCGDCGAQGARFLARTRTTTEQNNYFSFCIFLHLILNFTNLFIILPSFLYH